MDDVVVGRHACSRSVQQRKEEEAAAEVNVDDMFRSAHPFNRHSESESCACCATQPPFTLGVGMAKPCKLMKHKRDWACLVKQSRFCSVSTPITKLASCDFGLSLSVVCNRKHACSCGSFHHKNRIDHSLITSTFSFESKMTR